MAPTFKIAWFKNRMRSDGSFAVYVCVTYKRKSLYLATPYSVLRSDLSGDLSKIRDERVADAVERHRRAIYLKYIEKAASEIHCCEDIIKMLRDGVSRQTCLSGGAAQRRRPLRLGVLSPPAAS